MLETLEAYRLNRLMFLRFKRLMHFTQGAILPLAGCALN
jgi:hypothetical protein